MSKSLIGVLDQNRSYIQNLLNYFYIDNGYVVPEFSPFELIQDTQVLVIPSGGLSGLFYNESLRDKFREFTDLGGTIICFDQQYGFNYGILPVPENCTPIGGLGWAEAQSCFNFSTRTVDDHPMIASCDSDYFDAGVDGYFTSYPDNSVLLRSNASNYPVLIHYPCGNGYVIATTLYADWAFANYQASDLEARLVRDIIAWAIDREPCDFPINTATPTPTYVFNCDPISIHNSSATEIGRYIELTFLPPGRIPVLPDPTPELIDLGTDLLPGETTTFSYSNSVGPETGMYWMDYKLLNHDVTPISDTDNDHRLAFRTMNDGGGGTGLPNVTFYASPEVIPAGSDTTFIIQTNNAESIYAYEITVYGMEETLVLDGLLSSDETVCIPVENVNNNIRAWLTITYRIEYVTVLPQGGNSSPKDDITGVYEDIYEYYDKGVTVYPSRVDAEIQIENATTFKPGEMIPFSCMITNQSTGALDVVSRLWVTGSQGDLLYGPEDYEVSLGLNASHVQDFSVDSAGFCPGSGCAGKSYIIHLNVYDESPTTPIGGDVGQFSFDSTFQYVEIYHVLPVSGYQSGSENSVLFEVTPKVNLDCENGHTFFLELYAPEIINPIYSDSQYIDPLESQESFDLVFNNVDFGTLSKGVYRLECRFDSHCFSPPNNTLWSCQFLIPNEPFITGMFDKTSYRIRDDQTFTLQAMNRGWFTDTYTIEVSGLDMTPTPVQITLPAQQRTPTPIVFQTVVDENRQAGNYPVTVQTLNSRGGRSLSSDYYFLVPDSYVIPELNVSMCGANTNVPVEFVNTGGVDTTSEYCFSLVGPFRNETVVSSICNTIDIPAGQQSTGTVLIPDQTASGYHQFIISQTDLNNNHQNHFRKPFKVNGIDAVGSIAITDPYFRVDEAVEGIVSLQATENPIANAMMTLRVEKAANATVSTQWIGDDQLVGYGVTNNTYQMSPNGLKTFGPTGFWTGQYDCQISDFNWTDLRWSGQIPEGTFLGVRVRAANDLISLQNARWIPESPKTDYFDIPGLNTKWEWNQGDYATNCYMAP
ncbi:MAG TPA: hypothetical protein PLV45_04720, partial [bacterium]|nr:hypothetical protein [bacterium]